MITFVHASVLFLLLLVPLAIGFLIWRSRARLAARQKLAQSVLYNRLFADLSQRRRILKAGLWLGTLTMVIIALARPVWGTDLDIIETQGVSVVFLLDVSNSMAAQDLTPSRLEQAKLTIRDLFKGLEGNAVGLVLFAGTAVVQLPLTTDTLSAVTFLNPVSTDAITQQGTNIEEAIRQGLQLYDQTSPTSRIMVLMTDGENHDGDVNTAVQSAVESDVSIYTIGYGDPQGAPVPEFDIDGNIIDYKTDEGNNVILSRLNEEGLQAISEATGGIYQRASSSGIEVVNLINRIREAAADTLESRQQQRGVERFAIFGAIGLLLLSVEMLLSETRQRPDEQAA
ncbi:MAG: VWA domain-containing protein [Anaerolineae bacterium]|nr:VWA domain-containing protein [Anaerolineae bacterium]